MKNKILLGSVTLRSALRIAACGNGEKKATETTAAPSTEATTATPTTTAPTTTSGASSETKEVSLADTQRIGREDTGYVNVPKDWKEFKEIEGNNPNQYQYSSIDGYNVVTLTGYSKDQVKLGNGDTFGAELVANRLYSTFENNSAIDKNPRCEIKSGWNGCFCHPSSHKRWKIFLHLDLPKRRKSIYSSL